MPESLSSVPRGAQVTYHVASHTLPRSMPVYWPYSGCKRAGARIPAAPNPGSFAYVFPPPRISWVIKVIGYLHLTHPTFSFRSREGFL